MSREVTYRSGLRILKRDPSDSSKILIDKNYQGTFVEDMSSNKGPVGGALTVTVGGRAVDLSEVTTPRWLVVRHCGRSDDSATQAGDHVEFGIRDPGTNVFYPFGEVRPGMEVPIPLSRNLLEEYAGTGTGTTAPGNQLFFKAWPVSQDVEIGVFDE